MAHLSVTLAVEVRWTLVTRRLDDVALDAGDVVAQLHLHVLDGPGSAP